MLSILRSARAPARSAFALLVRHHHCTATPATPRMSAFKLLIDGEAVSTEQTWDVLNPATGEAFAKCPDCTPEHVDAAVAAAKRAFPAWAATSIEERKEYVRKLEPVLQSHAEELAELLCKEQGKPKGGETAGRAATGATGEVARSIALFQSCADFLQLPEEVWKEDATHEVRIIRRPVGVVAAIAPWNFPLYCYLKKIVPALILGNTIVGKPSPFTPLTTLRLMELIKDCFPKGVINCVVSDDTRWKSGAHLTAHPDVNKVSFTGSVPTGKAIMKACALDVKRVTLELGGNDAGIVCKDVNVVEAAKGVFRGAFLNSGQICICLKRCYVHEDIHDQFVAELVKLAKDAKFGDGMLPDTDFGPLNNKNQLRIVSELVEDAKANGAKIETGGKAGEGAGFFYEPTIVTNVSEGVRLVDEEQFGPALPVIKFSDEDDAVARANNTKFGLGASAWSGDIDKANSIARRLIAGTVWVNEHVGNTYSAPFGGFKTSGLGREAGACDIDTYTEVQSVKLAKTA